MNGVAQPPPFFFPLFAVGWAWLACFIAASIVFRRRRGKPVFPRPPADAIYKEGWASGASQRNLITQLGGARNCLIVALTPKMLLVTPRFPFNLMFLPEIYGLELCLDRRAIRSVQPLSGWGPNNIRVAFADAAGRDQAIDLRLRHPDAFIAAAQRLR